ncbi:hypothetical protein IQ289_25515 [Burkholderia sp. R-70006]|nr:hypothetical protein [Burkholderia sp. R-70006]
MVYRVSDPNRIAAHMNSKDRTGMTLHQMGFLAKVEHWVLRRLEGQGERAVEEVHTRLQRLDDIITNYRNQIPPDNPAFLQILSWLQFDEATYTVEYLQEGQPDFFMQLIDFCRANRRNDPNAALAINRIFALLRTQLLDRIFSKANVDYVATTLVGAS